MTVSQIIDLLGGSSAIARHTGWPVTTIDSWQHNRHIPEWRRPALLRLAMEQSVALSTADFPAKPAKREAA